MRSVVNKGITHSQNEIDNICLKREKNGRPEKKYTSFLILVHSPSAHSVNSSHPNGTNMLSRNRTSSTTNPNAITSPFSPLNNNSNHIDQNSQSMSPKLSGEHPSMLNSTPLTTNDLSASVRVFI